LDDGSQQLQKPSTPPKRKRASKSKPAPLTEAEVRRSLRIKKANNGFKALACKDRNCLGCSAVPPTISPKIIRDLGAAFCNIDPEELSEDKLNVKPKKSKVESKKAKKGKKDHSSSSQVSSS